MRARLAIATVIGCLACAASAGAGNDEEMLVGNRASMTGGAVSATVSDASSIWYNPAGLGADARDKIDVSATAYSLRHYAVPRFLSSTSGGGQDGAVTEFVSVPTQIAYVRRLQLYQDTDISLNQSLGTADAPRLFARAERPVEEGFHLEFLRAGQAGFALAYRVGEGWVAGELDVHPALVRPEVDVNRRAFVNARLGIYQRVTPSLALGAGLFTDRRSNAVRWGLLSGGGDFYGGTVGMEIGNERHLAPSEPVGSLTFSTFFALRYAFSDGYFGRAIGNPDATPTDQPFQTARSALRVHEIALYVGSALHF